MPSRDTVVGLQRLARWAYQQGTCTCSQAASEAAIGVGPPSLWLARTSQLSKSGHPAARLRFSLPAGVQGFSTAAVAAQKPPKSLTRRLKALIHNYKQLSKFKLSFLVALTSSAGYAAGSGDQLDWAGLLWTSLGTFGAAACANSLNQVYEVFNDRQMSRTCNRPLPAGRLGKAHALAFAVFTGALGLWILSDKTNSLTTQLGAANILLYAGIYTPLKQVSVINTWVGALVGAIPPLMGWAAAAGQLEPGAWVLAAALFSWQMPHFMALAWLNKEDYARGRFRMLPSIDPTGRRTAAVALRHCALLLPIGAVAAALQIASPWFAAEAAALAAVMGVGAMHFTWTPSQTSARRLFRGSLLYLPLLLLGVVAHRQPNNHQVDLAYIRHMLQERHGITLPTFPQLPEVRMRTFQERLSYVVELQQQMKCPSRVYGEVRSEEDQGQNQEAQQQQEQQQQQQ